MVIDLIAVPSHSLKQALSAILSIFCSTGKGILYLTKDQQEMTTIEKFVDILKDQDDNSVALRFCLSGLQKLSFQAARSNSTKIIAALIAKGLIEWLVKFLDRSRMRSDANTFCLEFASALLVNMLSTQAGQEHVQKNAKLAKELVTVSLNMVKEKIPPGVIWHILTALSHLTQQKEKYAAAFNETNFSDKMSDFHEFYAQINPNGKIS